MPAAPGPKLVKIETSKQAGVVRSLLTFFSAKCSERSTLTELLSMSETQSSWGRGHALFQDIRKKTLAVERELKKTLQFRRKHFERLASQYLLEEICAKTLYILSGYSAPFDADSPDWIVANAINLGNKFGIDQRVIFDIVDDAS